MPDVCAGKTASGASDLLPRIWTVLSWNFPLMIPVSAGGEFHEAIEVHRGADCVCVEAGKKLFKL
jgi:hypothetical protein